MAARRMIGRLGVLVALTAMLSAAIGCDQAPPSSSPPAQAPSKPAAPPEKPPSPGAGAPAGGVAKTPEKVTVRVKDEAFQVEVALDESSRIKGLSGREKIEERGGMLFVFPRAFRQQFVMRDCPNPIDIAFLDGAGRVLAVHEMTPEEPRRADESAEAYENRLKRYDSRFPAQFALEVAGGTLRRIGLQVGDLIVLDAEGLKARAR